MKLATQCGFTMEQMVKIDQIPQEADQLYIKLYCERKGGNDEVTVQDARKSWMALKNSEKKKFYKTIADRNLLNYAHRLSKTEIYLKEKPSIISHQSKSHSSLSARVHGELDQDLTVPSINESHSLGNTSQPIEENALRNQRLTPLQEDNGPSNDRDQNETNLEDCEEPEEASVGMDLDPVDESRHTNQLEREDRLETQSNVSSCQRATIPLVEPTPPTVKVGKDLYDVIKRPENPEWKELTPKQRKNYNRAVRTIKREYIKKYILFLESLSQQQLFNHYMKTLH